MSLGIFSFAMMGLLGLIPAAVTTHRDAKMDTVLAQIKQRLVAEVMLTDGDQLAALNNFERAFDAEGRELANTRDMGAVYRGKIQIAQYTAPGAPGQSESLLCIKLFAVHDPSASKINDPAAPPSGAVLIPKAASATAGTAASGGI